MSSFNDECYVANEDYDAGDRDNGGHTEKPLSSKVASFEDSYMPDLVSEENRDDGEIVGDPVVFVEHWTHWTVLVVLPWMFLMVEFSLVIWLLHNRELVPCLQHLSTEPEICPIHWWYNR